MSMSGPEITPTARVMYSCHDCGLKKVGVNVPARTGEDVAMWMQVILTPALVADHCQRSPHCKPDSLADVMIPITDRIGGAPVQ
jgi:hypothetical protein